VTDGLLLPRYRQILYAAANKAVQSARQFLRTGDIDSRSREITRAQEILIELASSVDSSKAPEFGERLLALYDYLQCRLAEANVQQRDWPLAEVGNLLGTLQEAWSQCTSIKQPELALAEV